MIHVKEQCKSRNFDILKGKMMLRLMGNGVKYINLSKGVICLHVLNMIEPFSPFFFFFWDKQERGIFKKLLYAGHLRAFSLVRAFLFLVRFTAGNLCTLPFVFSNFPLLCFPLVC